MACGGRAVAEKNLYAIELNWTALVWAESPEAAEREALGDIHAITADCEPYVHCVETNVTAKRVKMYDWDLDAIPYGDCDDKTVGQLLDEVEARPVPDTKTLPLFGDDKPENGGTKT